MITSSRRYVGGVERSSSTSIPNFVSTTEIDNHADTCCFGANFTPLYFTGHVCQVQPFIDSYKSIDNVEICTAATAFDDETSGLTYILVFNQGLWFGSKLQHSLINPNQCRANGIQLCDDPFDPFRNISIYDPVNDLTIPLHMNGTICYLNTRVPTPQELKDCPHIVMTSDLPWDPSVLDTTFAPKEEEHLFRGIREIRTAASIPISYESDLALSQISDALTQPTLLPANGPFLFRHRCGELPQQSVGA